MARFLVEASFYVYGETAKEAYDEAKKIKKGNIDSRDNQFTIDKMYETPFKSISNSRVKIKDL